MDRPDYVPEEFWNPESGEIKAEDVFKHLGSLGTQHEELTQQHTTLQSEHDKLKGQLPGEPPEKYELKLEDGTTLSDPAVEAFTPALKELGVTEEGAQKLFGLYVKELERQDAELSKVYEDQRTKWAETSKADSEFGGDKFDETLKVAQQAIGRFGSDDLKTLLEETGLGNHPEVIRMFWKLGTSISEDQTLQSSSGDRSEQDVARLMFPNSPQARSQ